MSKQYLMEGPCGPASWNWMARAKNHTSEQCMSSRLGPILIGTSETTRPRYEPTALLDLVPEPA